MTERRIFFVCGAPKSGTTWLQRVLDAHPEVMCSGEGHFVDRFMMPLADLVRDYNRQQAQVAERVYEGRPYYQPVEQALFDRLARVFIVDRLHARGPGPAVRWVGDKTPRYALGLGSLMRIFPDARFVNIIRDPRDAAMSRLFHAGRAGMPDALEPGSARQIEITRVGAQDWTRNVQPIADFMTGNPGHMHSLRYEDLHADPVATMASLFDFLDVSADRTLLDRLARETSFEAQSGRKAGVENPESFLRKGVVGDWRGRLHPMAVAVVEEVCGPLMRANGYL
jgi:hypothetical protein